ncbi:MAG: efflux RND transporter periplasmic adaptor subunit [Aquabacterium sp.]|nr:MAG: efflux RND transporter periplasmic adaptor subunit [Aquabacterium sp.]TAL23277.1 MAG: efflux RND transporter periplasmic adaptor subunit [Aquabacterium sp.]
MGLPIVASAAVALAIGLGLGWSLAMRQSTAHGTSATAAADSTSRAPDAGSAGSGSTDATGRKVLYWYDPMVPQQRFDKPGKSPFMDMQLVPKYADEAAGGSIAVDTGLAQALGMRTARVERRDVAQVAEVVGAVALNERDVAIVQARAAGFVQRVARLAPGDVIAPGALIAELLVPEWAGAQREYLAVRRTGDAALTAAARQRLVWLGMPLALVDQLERSGQVQATQVVQAPLGGLLEELAVRPGMTVAPGSTLARITGLASVWIEAAVPQEQAALAVVGQPAQIRLPAFAGQALDGRVLAVLPQADSNTRTLRVRIELPNPQGRLRAGMFAQVRLAAARRQALVVPSDAVIRTGQRALVYLVEAAGRFRPVPVQLGEQLGEHTEVLQGLEAGQQVVASGQFLIDSEASMQGLLQRQATLAPAPSSGPAAALPVHQADGTITEISADEVTLDHGPVPSLQWGAMQMAFKLSRPELARGLRAGQRVHFEFVQTDDGFEIRALQPQPPASSSAQGNPKGAR